MPPRPASDETLDWKVEAAALGAIVLVAAVLRFYHLHQQGFVVFDESAYVAAAKTIVDDAVRLAEAQQTTPRRILIEHSFYQPGFISMLIVNSRLVGVSPFSGTSVSAVLGLLTVVTVYGITRRLFCRPAALIATALLATSTHHIFYSRVGLSSAAATFFFTAGLYWWLCYCANRTQARASPFIAGLLFGYAFTCHDGFLPFLGMGLLLEGWQAIQVRAFRGTLLLLFGVLIPLYGFYAQTGLFLWKEIHRLEQTAQSSGDTLYYLRLLWRYEMLPFTLLALGGILRAGRVWRRHGLDGEGGLYAVLFTSLILLSIGAGRGAGAPRLMAPLLPLLAVLVGGAVTLLMDSALIRHGRTAFWGATLGLILLVGLVGNRGFFSWHSGFAEATQYLHTHYPASRIACYGSRPICEFYQLGDLVSTIQQLEMVVPPPELLFAHALDPAWEDGIFGVLASKPVGQFENPIERDPRVREENGGGAGSTLGVIRIYDLQLEKTGRRLEPTPLMLAAARGDTTAGVALLDTGGDVAAKDREGRTALMYAARQGHTATVMTLLDKGADVEVKDTDGTTALMYAAAYGRPAVVIALLARGADVNAKTKESATALMYAAAYDDPTTMTALLNQGADIEASDNGGRTALMFAVVYGRPAVVKALLARGADVQARDGRGVTALMFARAKRYLGIVRLLKNAGATD